MIHFKSKKFNLGLKVNKDSKMIYTICASVLLITLSIFNFSLYHWQQYKLIRNPKVEGAQNEIVVGLDYWYKMASQHPDYIVAWLEIAKLEKLRGNTQASKKALEFAEDIEPNFPELIKTKNGLGL